MPSPSIYTNPIISNQFQAPSPTAPSDILIIMNNRSLGFLGFMLSFTLSKEYSSPTPNNPRSYKYLSYAVLKNSVLPALKTMDAQFISTATRQYFEQVNREIFKPF